MINTVTFSLQVKHITGAVTTEQVIITAKKAEQLGWDRFPDSQEIVVTSASVEVQQKCQHTEGTTPSYDYVTCNVCGMIRRGFDERHHGIAAGKWFDSVEAAEFYQKNGRLPEDV